MTAASSSLPRPTAEAEATAAARISSQWLALASECIARGETPELLTASAHRLAAGAWEEGQPLARFRYTQAAHSRIASAALADTRLRLKIGDFPSVLSYLLAQRAAR